MIDEFNEALAAMKEDGTYDQIMQKWLGDSYTSSSTSSSSNSSAASSTLTLTGDASAKATPVKSTYKIVMDSSFAPLNTK